jgi:2'-5' RNA ligase
MADTTRTFIAVPMPEAVAAALARLTEKLAPQIPGARWVAPSHFHITMAFLGEVDSCDLADVCRATAEAVRPFEPFSLRVARLGAFPDLHRPRVLWAGLSGDALPQLESLQKAVAAAARRAGYPPDGRFSAHLTLARFKPAKGHPADLRDVPGRFARWMAGDMLVREVVTYASVLGPDGPEYTPLARAPLAPAGPNSPA